MTPTFNASAKNLSSINATTGTVVLPAGLLGGDLIKLELYQGGTSGFAAASVPTGFTAPTGNTATTISGTARKTIFYAIAPGTIGSASSWASTTVTITFNASTAYSLIADCYTGVDQTNPINFISVVAASVAGLTHNAPSGTTTGATLVTESYIDKGTASTITPPGTITQRASEPLTGGAVASHVTGDYNTSTAAGTVGGDTWTSTLNTATAILATVALLSASSGAVTGTVGMAGAGALAVAGTDSTFGTISMSGAGAMAVAGTDTISSAVAMSGAGVMGVTSQGVATGSVAMAGTGAMAVAGSQSTLGTVGMAGAGALAVAGSETHIGVVAMAGAGTLTIVPTPPGTLVYAMSGANAPDRFMVSAKITSGTKIRVKYSTSITLSSASFSVSATPDSFGYARFDITGLAAGTRYYYQLMDTPPGEPEVAIGGIHVSRTTPSATAGPTVRVAVGSCTLTATAQSDVAFGDIIGWDPDWHVNLGDAYYNGPGASSDGTVNQHYALWDSQVSSVSAWAQCLSAVPLDYDNSDHELNPDNTDTYSGFDNFNADTFNQFMAAALPVRLVDTATTPRGKWRSKIVSGIRFIIIDIRNLDRSPGANTDNSSKTMLGATQKAWLKNELLDANDSIPTLLKVVLCDVPWMGTATLANGIDKWWAYATERAEIGNFIIANGVNVDFIHGDSHRIAVDRTHNNGTLGIGNFPVICGSAYSQVGGGAETNGTWDAYYPTTAINISQYMRLTYTWLDSQTIQRQAVGWDAINQSNQSITQTFIWNSGPIPMAGAGTMTVAGNETHSGTVGMSGAGTMGVVAGAATLSGTVGMAGAGSMGVAGSVVRTGPVTMAGVGAMTVAGTRSISGTVAMAGAGSMAVTALISHSGTVAMVGTGSLAVAGTDTIPSTVGMAGSGALFISPGGTETGAVGMAGAGALTVAGLQALNGTVGMAGAGTLTVAGFLSQSGTVAMAGAGALAVASALTRVGIVAMAGAGALSITGNDVVIGAVTMAGVGAMGVSAGGSTQTGTVAMAGAGTLAVAGIKVVAPSVAMVGSGTMTVAGFSNQTGTVTMAGAGALAIAGTRSLVAAVAMAGHGVLSVGVGGVVTSSVAMAGVGTLLVAAPPVGRFQLAYSVASDTYAISVAAPEIGVNA